MNKVLNNRPVMELLERQHVRAMEAGRGQATRKLAANDLIGVEIELEDFRGERARVREAWDEHGDGSLVDGREFVLYPPRSGDKLVEAIDMFFNAGFRYSGGERTSVHVHIDMTDGILVGQFRSLFAITFLLEDAIYHIADEHRKWGGYSSPLIDMAPTRMNKILAATTENAFSAGVGGQDHEDRYYGFNCVALKKHGTMEFRYFPCTDNKTVLLSWVNLVLELKKAALQYNDPEQFLDLITDEAAVTAWVQANLPKSAAGLLEYMDRGDVLDRKRLLKAIINDKNAAQYREPAPRVSKSLKKLAIKRGWAHEDNGEQERVVDQAGPVLAFADVVGPDGQINMPRYLELLEQVRQRNARRR